MSTKSPVATRADYAWLAAIIALLAVVHFIVGRLPCVGDETRYAFQGVGLYSSGSFYPQATLWRPFAAASGCGNGGVLSTDRPGRPLQTISTSVLYGAALRTVGIEGARWLNFIVGCVGLSLLYFLLMRRFRASGGASWAARIAVASLALTLPFVPYLQLIYPETLLFTAVSGALYALLRRFRYAGLAAVIALPFLHERALPLAMGFFVVLLLQMAHDRAPIAFIARVCALFAAGMALLAATQLWLYGSLFGSAFPAYSPSISIAFARIGMQLYDVRHGAIAYTPLLIVAVAGLLLGALRRDRVCSAALALFAIYFATFMWSTAQESWTARFWVAGLPFLAIGLCYWLYSAKRWWEWLPALPPFILSAVNAATYVVYPLWFLESRISSIPYAALFLTTHLHFGLLLPVDADPGGIPPYTRPIGTLLLFTTIVVALLVWCRTPRTTVWRAIACTLACAASLAPILFCFARSINVGDYSVAVLPSQSRFVVHLRGNARIDAVQFDDQIPAFWTAPPYPLTFSIRCLRNGVVAYQTTVPAHPLLILEHCTNVDTIEIVGDPSGHDRAVYARMGPIRLITRGL